MGMAKLEVEVEMGDGEISSSWKGRESSIPCSWASNNRSPVIRTQSTSRVAYCSL